MVDSKGNDPIWDETIEIAAKRWGGQDKVAPPDISQDKGIHGTVQNRGNTEASKGEQGNSSPQEKREVKPYSPVQLLFLLRLARLLRQRREYVNVLQPEDWRLRLLNKAIYSTYGDTLELGISEDAKALFERDKAQNRDS